MLLLLLLLLLLAPTLGIALGMALAASLIGSALTSGTADKAATGGDISPLRLCSACTVSARALATALLEGLVIGPDPEVLAAAR